MHNGSFNLHTANSLINVEMVDGVANVLGQVGEDDAVTESYELTLSDLLDLATAGPVVIENLSAGNEGI